MFSRQWKLLYDSLGPIFEMYNEGFKVVFVKRFLERFLGFCNYPGFYLGTGLASGISRLE